MPYISNSRSRLFYYRNIVLTINSIRLKITHWIACFQYNLYILLFNFSASWYYCLPSTLIMAGAYVVMIYGSWIYNYLCNQFLSLLKLWVSNPTHGKVYSIHKIKFLSGYFLFHYCWTLNTINLALSPKPSYNFLNFLSELSALISLKVVIQMIGWLLFNVKSAVF
jgi:hypothetical protein